MSEPYIEWQLILKKLRGDLSAAESELFDNWLRFNAKHRQYFDNVCRAWQDSGSEERDLSSADLQQLMLDFDRYVQQTPRRFVHRQHRLKYIIKHWARVAAILFYTVIAVSAIYWATQINSSSRDKEPIAQGPILEDKTPHLAELVLTDGRRIVLDTLSDGTLQYEPGVRIRKEGHVIRYLSINNQPNHCRNAIYVPVASSYRLVLADGSKITLNGGSSMVFPVGFNAQERRCYLNGEGFFEVIKSSTPFIVSTNGADIKVLGTSFNIRSYNEENSVVTTLISGAVSMDTDQESIEIKPGQEAIFEAGRKMRVRPVNTYATCSWLAETLIVENENLQYLTRRLSKIFNAEFLFESSDLKELHFTGEFDRTKGLDYCLNRLVMTSDITYEKLNTSPNPKYIIKRKL